jgi:serine/threonine protein kinase
MLPVAECNLQEYYDLVPSSPDKLSLLRSFLGCLSSALQYIHSIKVRHRDIKPHNILVKSDRVYLTDFGIALDWQHLTRSTTTADSGKTWIYAAPEVARYEKRNTAADVWSLGCVFFEIATVVKSSAITDIRAFFDSKSGNHRFYANIANFSRWAATLRGKGSSKDDIIFKWVRAMLEENPEDRPTAAELFEDIVSETYAQKMSFCGTCCLEVMDASSVEGDGDDEDDPWSQVAELTL